MTPAFLEGRVHGAPRSRRAWRRRRRRKRRWGAVAVALWLAALAIAAATFVTQDDLSPATPSLEHRSVTRVVRTEADASARERPGRLVYPFSVVKGGVHSRDDLEHAVASDRVVAAHYVDFDVERAQLVPLGQPTLAFVSYRVKDDVFWTRKPVRLAAGELVITDGVQVARARCGNRIADTPGQTSELEPAPGVMDTPITALPLFPLRRPIDVGGVLGDVGTPPSPVPPVAIPPVDVFGPTGTVVIPPPAMPLPDPDDPRETKTVPEPGETVMLLLAATAFAAWKRARRRTRPAAQMASLPPRTR